MKKTFYTFIALAGLAMFTSCSSDSAEDEGTAKSKVAMTFTATQESKSMPQRTIINDTKIEWQNTDLVTVWDGTIKNSFSVTPTQDDATSASLAGYITNGSTSFIAVYPNSVGLKCTYTSSAITGLVIPEVQTATAGTYDPAAAIMTASSTSSSLAFKNVCAFLKITTTKAYTKIVVTSQGDNAAPISGEFSVTDFGTAPALTAADSNTSTTVTLQTDGTTTFAAGTYYIAIAPGSYRGIGVARYTDATNFSESSKASVTFVRSNVYDMGSM